MMCFYSFTDINSKVATRILVIICLHNNLLSAWYKTIIQNDADLSSSGTYFNWSYGPVLYYLLTYM